MPPRRHTAIFGASLVSCLAWPPWLACIARAWPRTNGRPSRAQRSASQVPGEETFDAHNHVLTVGCTRFQTRFRPCFQMPRPQDLPLLVQEAEGPWCGRASRSHHQTGAAGCKISWGLLLLRLLLFAQRQQSHVVCGGGGLNKYQRHGADAVNRAAHAWPFGCFNQGRYHYSLWEKLLRCNICERVWHRT
jgi:hypothetical protein